MNIQERKVAIIDDDFPTVEVMVRGIESLREDLQVAGFTESG